MSALWQPLPEGGEMLVLRPNRSLSPRGFAGFFLVTFALAMLPLLPLLGTAALWMILPFILGALLLTWVLLRRSFREGLSERLVLGQGLVRLSRSEPGRVQRDWEADPYSVQVRLHSRPVENYLTLAGGPREVEIGAFLAPQERLELKPQIERALARAAGYGAPGG